MDIPEELRRTVDELGEALVAALLGDPRCRDLVLAVQRAGFELSLSLEATPAPGEAPAAEALWSPADLALLKTFRILVE